MTSHRFDDMLPNVEELSRVLPHGPGPRPNIELWGALAVTGRAVVRRHWTDRVELDRSTFEQKRQAGTSARLANPRW